MGKQYDDEEDDATGMTEVQAQRLVKWIIDHDHTEAEAYEALAYVMGAAVE